MKKFERDINPIKDQNVEKKPSFNLLNKPQHTIHDAKTDPLLSAKEELKVGGSVKGENIHTVLSDIASRSAKGEKIGSAYDYLNTSQESKEVSTTTLESFNEDNLVKNIEKYEKNLRNKINKDEENILANALNDIKNKMLERDIKQKKEETLKNDLLEINNEIDNISKNISKNEEAIDKVDKRQEEYIQAFSQEDLLDRLLDPIKSKDLIDQKYLKLREQLAKDEDTEALSKAFLYVKQQKIDRTKAFNTDIRFDYQQILDEKSLLAKSVTGLFKDRKELIKQVTKIENNIKLVDKEIKDIDMQLSHIQGSTIFSGENKEHNDNIENKVRKDVLKHLERKKIAREETINELNDAITVLKSAGKEFESQQSKLDKAKREAKQIKGMIKEYQEK
jgi:hypothetical protein